MDWFGKFFKNKKIAPDGIPPDLFDALLKVDIERAASSIRLWAVGKVRSDGEEIQKIALKAGWGLRDVEKLGIYFDYYNGAIDKAFYRAKIFFVEYSFDGDLFVISIIALYQNGQFDDAFLLLSTIDESVSDLNGRSDYLFVRALVFWAVNDMLGLKRIIQRFLDVETNDRVALENVFIMSVELGDGDLIKKVRNILDAHQEAHGYVYSLGILALGDYKNGFRYMENRYEMAEAPRYFNRSLFLSPRWSGGAIGNKTLLVSAEQGLGDTIQFSRYISSLKNDFCGNARLIVEVQPELVSLLEHSFPSVDFFERDCGSFPKESFDQWIGMMSLPFLMDCFDERGGAGAYLSVPSEALSYWKNRVSDLADGCRPRIGLAWSGQPSHRADRRRSIPFEIVMEAVEGIDANFFVLQTDVPDMLPKNVKDVSEELLTMADTAALISEMDLIVSVDTSVIHLAGAIGQAALLLLPFRYEWRWGLDGEKNLWYDSVKVIRQTSHGDWKSVLDKVFSDVYPSEIEGKREK